MGARVEEGLCARRAVMDCAGDMRKKTMRLEGGAWRREAGEAKKRPGELRESWASRGLSAKGRGRPSRRISMASEKA